VTLQVGDKAVVIPLRDGGRVVISSGTVSPGDKVVLIPGPGGQFYVARLALPVESGEVILYPLRGGGYATLQNADASGLTGFPVAAWGDDSAGQCTIPKGLLAVQVSAGYSHSLALRSDGAVIAWGDNTYGQCSVPAGLRAKWVAAGYNHSLAVRLDGTVAAWGRNTSGQCNVPEGLIAAQVDGGALHTIALREDGTIVAWGDNTYGQCDVPGSITALQVSAGANFCLALLGDKKVRAWGYNGEGQTYVPYISTASQVSAGGGHALAIDSFIPRVEAWGDNTCGQTTVPAGLIPARVSAGYQHSLALHYGGEVVAWGDDSAGQCTIPKGLLAVQVSAGAGHSLALRFSGTVRWVTLDDWVFGPGSEDFDGFVVDGTVSVVEDADRGYVIDILYPKNTYGGGHASAVLTSPPLGPVGAYKTEFWFKCSVGTNSYYRPSARVIIKSAGGTHLFRYTDLANFKPAGVWAPNEWFRFVCVMHADVNIIDSYLYDAEGVLLQQSQASYISFGVPASILLSVEAFHQYSTETHFYFGGIKFSYTEMYPDPVDG